MDYITYRFHDINPESGSSYIFQTVKNKKLSDTYHSHDFYEWIVVLEGSCTQIINETQVVSSKNTCLLLCPGDRHKIISQSKDVSIISFSVEKNEGDCFIRAFGINNLNTYSAVLSPLQMMPLSTLCRAELPFEHKLFLANLIKIYIEHSEKKDDAPDRLKTAISQMRQTENLGCGIEKFTELSGFSRSHLNRLMKKYYDITLHDFIVDTKLKSAYNALILTDIHIEDLSETLGYASFSHFNKIFKEKYGITPSALQKKRFSR